MNKCIEIKLELMDEIHGIVCVISLHMLSTSYALRMHCKNTAHPLRSAGAPAAITLCNPMTALLTQQICKTGFSQSVSENSALDGFDNWMRADG